MKPTAKISWPVLLDVPGICGCSVYIPAIVLTDLDPGVRYENWKNALRRDALLKLQKELGIKSNPF